MYLAVIWIVVMFAIIVCLFPIFSCVFASNICVLLHLRFSVVGLTNFFLLFEWGLLIALDV